MTVTERLAAFRAVMRQKQLDMAIVPSADPHHSEYLPEHYKARAWLSGFTGSAGTLVITDKDAVLYTDGRYFIQAENQLAGSGIALMRMRVEGVPELEDYVADRCMPGFTVGADLSLVTEAQARKWREQWEAKGARLVDSGDLFETIWTDRTGLPTAEATELPEKVAGESVAAKLARIRQKMSEKQAGKHLISVLDEIAWTLNVRGGDVANTPVVLSYLLVLEDRAIWFVDERKVPETLREQLASAGVETAEYETLKAVLTELPADAGVMLDPANTAADIVACLGKERVIEAEDPVYRMKCVKNEREIEGLRHCHELDGAAVTRFMYWLKQQKSCEGLDELTASRRLAAFREEQEDYLSPSFETICAYGSNAAMMHYKATEASNTKVLPEGFLLIDSGGQYTDGTTDITRTFVTGPVSETQKEHFTAVLRAVIRLASARFLSGMSGKSLDILARGPIWDLGIDYRCGTGHGVGFRLNVHEGPNSFRWHSSATKSEETPLEPGMVTTDEPGIYLEGEYGIRTENELLCRVRESNEYGTFLEFETITMVPVDLDGVIPERLSTEEKAWFNAYHETVRERILPYMQTEEERDWLRYATRSI